MMCFYEYLDDWVIAFFYPFILIYVDFILLFYSKRDMECDVIWLTNYQVYNQPKQSKNSYVDNVFS